MKNSHPLALGIAIGVLWAIYVFVVGITAIYGWGDVLVEVLASLYIGYGPSLAGAIIGAIWAFVDGFIAGIVIAWVYNFVATGRFAPEGHGPEGHGTATSHPSGA